MNDSTPPVRTSSLIPAWRPGERIVHVHIPKTAGTAVRHAVEKAMAGRMRVFTDPDWRRFVGVDPGAHDFYSGHIGFDQAERIGGRLITVLRDPIERFLSVYYFWRHLYQTGAERHRKTALAMNYSIDEFVLMRDEPVMNEELFNAITWQLATGAQQDHRQAWRDAGRTEEDLFATALRNAQRFDVIGIQDDPVALAASLYRLLGVSVHLDVVNATRPPEGSSSSLRLQTLQRIHEWVYLDIELYRRVRNLVRERSGQPMVPLS